MVGKKLLIAKELLKQAAGILVQSLAQPLLQPLHGTTTHTLLTAEALARQLEEGFGFAEAFGVDLRLEFFLASGSAPALACARLARVWAIVSST